MHDFYSDTQTRPTRAMREAALDVPLGDERHDADPCTAALCERVADMLEPDDIIRTHLRSAFRVSG